MNQIKLFLEIDKWQSENIITKEQATEIKSRYNQKEVTKYNNVSNSSSKIDLSTFITIFAALFISIGIIVILSTNWSNFSTTLKVVLSLLPLFASVPLCIYTFNKKINSIPYKNFATIFNFFALIGAISLITRIFHLDGSLANLAIVIACLTLPLAFIFNTPISMLLASILCMSGTSAFLTLTPSIMQCFSYSIFLVCFAVFINVYRYYTDATLNIEKKLLLVSTVLFAISPVLVIINMLNEISTYTLLSISIFSIFFFIFAELENIIYKNDSQKNYSKQYITIAKIISFIGLLLYTFNDYYIESYTTFLNAHLIFLICLVLIYALLYYHNLKTRGYKGKQYNNLMYVFITVLISTLTVQSLHLLPFLLLIAFYFYNGLKKGDFDAKSITKAVNLSFLLGIIELFIYTDNLLLKGSAFVIFGILALVLNKYKVKRGA